MLRLAGCVLAVALVAVGSGSALAQPVRLMLGCDTRDGSVELVFTLSNVGDTDLAVVPGHVQGGLPIGMKNVYIPHELELSVRVAGSSDSETFTYASRVSGVAGWLDDWLLPLPVGASFTLRVPPDRFYVSPGRRRLDITEQATIEARWLLRAPDVLNYDLWSGELRSNAITVPGACSAG